MSEKALDYKKKYKDLYVPKNKPVLIDIPEMDFIMVDGKGDPNDNLSFQQAVELLYGLSFTIKMSKMKGQKPQGYYEYVVPPLEGLWWVDGGCFSLIERDNWVWTLMIRQPEFVDSAVFAWAQEALHKKKPQLPVARARFEVFKEGLCVQCMHLGPYATEPETMVMMEEFMNANHVIDLVGEGGKHHEIYLSDPRKAKPESNKTVLRHPVRKS